MSSLPNMLVGEDLQFSFDYVAYITGGVTISNTSCTVVTGQNCVNVHSLAVSNTKVTFWTSALEVGQASFDIFAHLTDGTIKGERAKIRIM